EVIGLAQAAAVEDPTGREGGGDLRAAHQLARERVELVTDARAEVPRVSACVERRDVGVGATAGDAREPSTDRGVFEVARVVAVACAHEVADRERALEGGLSVVERGDEVERLFWELRVGNEGLERLRERARRHRLR